MPKEEGHSRSSIAKHLLPEGKVEENCLSAFVTEADIEAGSDIEPESEDSEDEM